MTSISRALGTYIFLLFLISASVSSANDVLSIGELLFGDVYSEDLLSPNNLLSSNNSTDFGFLLPILNNITGEPIDSFYDLREQEIKDENDAKWFSIASSNLIIIIEDMNRINPHLNNKDFAKIRDSSSDLYNHANKALIDSESLNVSSVLQDAKIEYQEILLSVINASNNLIVASNASQENNIVSSLNFELAKQNLNEARMHIKAMINLII